MAYYAVCNIDGPVSVRLEASTLKEARALFEELNHRVEIEGMATDAEVDLGIDNAEKMSESRFEKALVDAGARFEYRIEASGDPLRDGWTLWSIDE